MLTSSQKVLALRLAECIHYGEVDFDILLDQMHEAQEDGYNNKEILDYWAESSYKYEYCKTALDKLYLEVAYKNKGGKYDYIRNIRSGRSNTKVPSI